MKKRTIENSINTINPIDVNKFRIPGSELREALAVAEEGLRRWPDAVLAHWASQLEEELAAADAERC